MSSWQLVSNKSILAQGMVSRRRLQTNYELEQLERLRSEDTPAAPFKFKFYNFVITLTHNTPSNGSDYLWQIWK